MINRQVLLLIVPIVFFVTLPPSECRAVTGLGIGARVGFIFDYDHPQLKKEKIEPKDLSMFGGQLTLLSISKLSVELSGEYTYRDYRREIVSPFDGGIEATTAIVTFKVRDYAAYATARYKLIEGNLGIHLGGGINAHRFTYGMNLPYKIPWLDDAVEIPGNGWHTGFHTLVGVSLGMPMMPFRAFGEVRLTKINVSGKASQQAAIIGGLTFGAF